MFRPNYTPTTRSDMVADQGPELCCATVFITICDTYNLVFDPKCGTFNLFFVDSTCGPCECSVRCNEVDFNAGLFNVTFNVTLTAEVEVCLDPDTLRTFCRVVNVTC